MAGPASAERTNLFNGLNTSSTFSPALPLQFIPKRIYRDNQLRQNQYFDELLARVSEDGKRFDPDGPTPSDLFKHGVVTFCCVTAVYSLGVFFASFLDALVCAIVFKCGAQIRYGLILTLRRVLQILDSLN